VVPDGVPNDVHTGGLRELLEERRTIVRTPAKSRCGSRRREPIAPGPRRIGFEIRWPISCRTVVPAAREGRRPRSRKNHRQAERETRSVGRSTRTEALSEWRMTRGDTRSSNGLFAGLNPDATPESELRRVHPHFDGRGPSEFLRRTDVIVPRIKRQFLFPSPAAVDIRCRIGRIESGTVGSDASWTMALLSV
jgi:hypothetical protein